MHRSQADKIIADINKHVINVNYRRLDMCGWCLCLCAHPRLSIRASCVCGSGVLKADLCFWNSSFTTDSPSESATSRKIIFRMFIWVETWRARVNMADFILARKRILISITHCEVCQRYKTGCLDEQACSPYRLAYISAKHLKVK